MAPPGRLPDRKGSWPAGWAQTGASSAAAGARGQLLPPRRLRSTGWDRPGGRKPAGKDTLQTQGEGAGGSAGETGRAAWAAELAPLQQILERPCQEAVRFSSFPPWAAPAPCIVIIIPMRLLASLGLR